MNKVGAWEKATSPPYRTPEVQSQVVLMIGKWQTVFDCSDNFVAALVLILCCNFLEVTVSI